MNRDRCVGGGVDPRGTLVIPELEEQVSAEGTPFTTEEDAVLEAYYGRVPASVLVDYWAKTFPAKRKRGSLANRAYRLGITRGRR